MPQSSPIPDRVRLDDLTDLASAVPYMLGFYPSDSLVAIALRGPRERLSFSMRLDVTDRDDDLPQRALVEAIEDALPMPVREAMLVDDGRTWSYLCSDEHCCPA